MILRANCKINLGLNITHKRADGYHNIESIFLPVPSLYDMIEILKRPRGVIEFSSSGINVDCHADDNLCVRAYRLMAEKFDIEGVAIHIHKNIPFGAGLGGGSSDATTVIKGINKLYDLGLNTGKLEDIASEIGSDTPFFVRNKPMYCHGRGEILEPVNVDLSGYYIIIVKPKVCVSTREAYSLISPKKPKENICDTVKKDMHLWRDGIINDFEQPIMTHYPLIRHIKNILYENGAVYASMSGSGSALFAISENAIDFPLIDEVEFVHSCFIDK